MAAVTAPRQKIGIHDSDFAILVLRSPSFDFGPAGYLKKFATRDRVFRRTACLVEMQGRVKQTVKAPPTTLAAGGSFSMIYNATQTAWN
jgi:hypothetical protein